MRVRMSSKGQVVIPRAIRERLGWTEGEELEVEVEGDRVVLRKGGLETRPSGWHRWRGSLRGTGALEELERDHAEEVGRETIRPGRLGGPGLASG